MSLDDLLKALGNGNNTEGKKGGPGSGPHNPTSPSISDAEADFNKAPEHINSAIHQEGKPAETFTPGKYLSDAQKQHFVEYMTSKGLQDQIPEDYKDYVPSDTPYPPVSSFHEKRKFANNLDPETGKFKIRVRRLK